MWKWGWKTLTGAFGIAIGIAGSPYGVDVFGAKASALIIAASILLNQIGIRAAIAKATPPAP